MALLEAALVLALIYRRYRVEVVPGQVIEPFNSLTLPMARGIRAVLTAR
jgi:cytochrome P450